MYLTINFFVTTCVCLHITIALALVSNPTHWLLFSFTEHAILLFLNLLLLSSTFLHASLTTSATQSTSDRGACCLTTPRTILLCWRSLLVSARDNPGITGVIVAYGDTLTQGWDCQSIMVHHCIWWTCHSMTGHVCSDHLSICNSRNEEDAKRWECLYQFNKRYSAG